MSLLNKVGDCFALDIGTTSVRVVQLTGSEGAWSLSHYAFSPVDVQVGASDASEDRRKLLDVITNVINHSGIRTKDVILGIPSSRTFSTVVDLPNMPAHELASTIKYQADQYIPTWNEETKLDWALLGKSPKDANKNEVLITAVSNTFIEPRLDMVESLGLNVVAMEPDAIAMMRSLSIPGSTEVQLIVELGDFNADIVIMHEGTPRIIRSINVGVQTLIKSVASNLNVEVAQAAQFIEKFGIQPDKLEGQVFRSVQPTLEQLSSEIDKSVKFFQARYTDANIQKLIVSNYASTVPGMSSYIAEKMGIQAVPGNPWQRIKVGKNDQAQLQPLASQFAVAIGLAERGAL